MKLIWNPWNMHFLRIKIDTLQSLVNLTVPYSHGNISARRQNKFLQVEYSSWILAPYVCIQVHKSLF
jgi:hypothetical protein